MGLKEKMINGSQKEVVDSAVRICRGYLNGPWKKISCNDVSVKRLSGGLSNFLYHVKLEGFIDCKPQQVLLRLYGQTHGEGAIENLITESVIFTLLSERKIGPKLYGVFPGGRIEEFIPADSLNLQELRTPEISVGIAEKLAIVHSMNIPINKEPKWLWDTMDRWLATIEKWGASLNEEPHKLLNTNLKEEAKWLKSHLLQIQSPVVFCHNDLQEGNILHQTNGNSSNLVFIDFEYCAYNYRGFELANHFIEWTYDYTHEEYPFYSVHYENYPSEENMRTFIEKYLDALYPDGKIVKPEVNDVKSIINEIKHFTLASHLFWCLWAIVNGRTSSIPFGYLEYANERFTSYQKLKTEILNSSKENAAIKRKVIE